MSLSSSTCPSFRQPERWLPPATPLSKILARSDDGGASGPPSANLTLLIFADSVHRIGLAGFCHDAKGRLDRSGFATFAKSDVKGMPLLCRIAVQQARAGRRTLLRMLFVSNFGVPPDPPYHYKYAGSQASTWYHAKDNVRRGNGTAAPTTLLERGTIRRFVRVLSLLQAADLTPDVVLVASALWDMARMEELGRGPGAWVPWVHVRGQSWPRSSRVEAWFPRNASISGDSSTVNGVRATAMGGAFVTAWQANATRLLSAIREYVSRINPHSLVIWQANPTLSDFYSGAVGRFMQALNQAAQVAVNEVNARLSTVATANFASEPSSRSCNVAYYDVEALLRIGQSNKWWGTAVGYPICCQEGYGHLRPRVMSTLYTNLLAGILRT